MSVITADHGKAMRLVVLALLFPLPVLAAGQPLAELLRLAEENHSDFLVQKADYEISSQAAPIARSNLLPQASATFNRQQGSDNDGNWSAGVSVSQPLYDLLQWRQWQAAKEQVKAAQINLDVARQDLRRDVILAWLDVQLAAETLRLVESRRKTLQAQRVRTEALAISGQVIEADVLLARARLASANSQWQQAKHDLAVARDEIIRTTDAAAANMQLVLAAPLPSLPPLDEWQRQVDESNLSVQAARQQTAAVRRRLQAAAASVQPRLSISGSLIARDSLGDIGEGWQLSVQQPLFTGGNLRAQQRQLIAESDRAHEQVAALLSRNAQTIKRLHGQMRADLERIDALAEAAAAQAALLEVVIVGYDNGVNIITEVLSAEEDLFDAQMNLRQAAYSYLRNLTMAKALLASGDSAFAEQIEKLFIPAEK